MTSAGAKCVGVCEHSIFFFIGMRHAENCDKGPVGNASSQNVDIRERGIEP